MRCIIGQREQAEYWQRVAAELPVLLSDAIDQGLLSEWVKANPNWVKSLGESKLFAQTVGNDLLPSEWLQLQDTL